jgi:sec-independent protein translocase protein TatC
MADETGGDPLDVIEEEEGGPVKSFLEHLEDLRWVLIKSLVALGVAMIVCFFGGNHVFRILELPLLKAPFDKYRKGPVVRVMFGTNQVGVLHGGGTNDLLTSLVGTNSVRFDIVPVTTGTNLLLSLNIVNDPNAQSRRESPIVITTFGPAAAFVVATKIAFYGGIILASPLIFYFIAQFVFPALRMREKKYVYGGLSFGAGLFLLGVAFCYFVMMPMTLALSAQYAEWFGFQVNQWRAEEYIAFVGKFMLGMGLGFEMPVLILTLVKLGILNYRILAGARRYVIIICFVAGAILTTPEVITQILLAVPLLALYEISVWIAWYWERRDRKRTEAGAV